MKNQVMESLGPYRMQASQIRLSTQTLGRGAFGDVKLGEVGGSRWTQKLSKQVAVKQLRANADMTIEEKRKLVIVSLFQRCLTVALILETFCFRSLRERCECGLVLMTLMSYLSLGSASTKSWIGHGSSRRI